MTAYKIMARNTRTNQRVVQQFLDGKPITDRTQALGFAQTLAEKQSQVTREPWTPEIDTYEYKA